VTAIYHITHANNLQRIIAEGGLRCDRDAQELKAVNIGHRHIKERRMNRRVPVGPEGTVGDYVPFYFAPRSPMLFAIDRGVVEGYADGQRPVIYLCSTAEAVKKAGLRWVFTEGHADMRFTDFFDDLKDLDKIDWDLMQSRYWNDTNDDPDRKRRRQAEFLVHEFFPWELVSYIGVYDRSIAEKAGEIIKGGSPELGIERGWYY
jgi:ssDNA thymidine ADP-ribosyltransferase DarT-like protein